MPNEAKTLFTFVNGMAADDTTITFSGKARNAADIATSDLKVEFFNMFDWEKIGE